MSQVPVLLELRGPVATLVLNRPEVHNAFNPALVERLTSLCAQLSADEAVRVLVLRGAGKSFCAGADLRSMQQAANWTTDENRDDAGRLASMFTAFRDCPKPVVACVHGAALGGGMGLVAVCDIVVAASSTRFAFTEARLGLAPAVISPFVLRKTGPGAALELFMTARNFSATDALRFGLVHRIAEDPRLDDELRAVLADLLRCGPQALAACKQLIASLAEMPARHLDLGTSLIAELRVSPEGRAGMEAFLERRPAPWVAEPPPALETV